RMQPRSHAIPAWAGMTWSLLTLFGHANAPGQYRGRLHGRTGGVPVVTGSDPRADDRHVPRTGLAARDTERCGAAVDLHLLRSSRCVARQRIRIQRWLGIVTAGRSGRSVERVRDSDPRP